MTAPDNSSSQEPKDGEELRIGVFVCRCGTNIAGFLDTETVREYAQTLPGVVFAKENLFTCSEAGVSEIKRGIEENRLNRVVVAACTPRTHEPLFRATCEEAGLNPFLFEFVNIREQCSWVHKSARDSATNKAKDLVRMGVARAALLEAQTEIRSPVVASALIIGGGIAGLSAALSLAKRGFEVKLVEKKEEMGGMLRFLGRIYPADVDAREIVSARIEEAANHPNIEIFTSTQVSDLRGYIGNYTATLRGPEDRSEGITVGVIIVATGIRALVPEGLYGYDGRRVVTQIQFEQELRKGGDLPHQVVFIQCVGSRNRERVYCSRICCMTAVRQALMLKEKTPSAGVHILYRDLQCYGVEFEELLRKAKKVGVRFVAFREENPPVVDDGSVTVISDVLGSELTVPADRVVLSTALLPDESGAATSKLLKVPVDADGFFLEAHVKLRPLDFATEGIFVCGACRWPCTVSESIAQALGAAGRASVYLAAGEVAVEPIVAVLFDEDKCRGCGLCASLCPYSAIEMVETDSGTKARMISVACKGCGVCASTCYRRVIRMEHYSDEQMQAQISACLKGS
ncbi:MAG: CoB--CoM heterodisulfide reductase iron-sulfur subunit A family protein [Candidatus Eisenbacteria sp.]|nr:CoB--CoM heterodisulfide reductase iron-sulfur subunit A family protein [Candidatus Eisenbacteria bacterium]